MDPVIIPHFLRTFCARTTTINEPTMECRAVDTNADDDQGDQRSVGRLIG